MQYRTGKQTEARLLNLVWLIVLSAWITSLFAVCAFLPALDARWWTKLLIVFAGSLAGVALAATLLFRSPQIRSCRTQASQLHAFCQAIKQASGTLELQEILDSAARVVMEVTGVRGCSIKLLDPGTGKLRARSIVGLEKGAVDQALDIVEDVHQQGRLSRDSVIVQDVLLRDFPAVDEEFESLICVPLRLEQRTLGTICIFGERGQKLSREMIALLSSLGNVVSLAIAHAFVYENLKNLVETKTKFLFQASHELRSPLTAIVSMARTLQEGHLGTLDERQREMLLRIVLRGQTLSEIVGDLLVLARGRARLLTLNPGRVDLRRLLREEAGFFETRAREKGVELRVQDRAGEAFVLGSEEGLHSVVTNLLANAVKYTPRDGKVDLKLFESKKQLVLEVSDTGIGIPREEQGRMFSEFFRASNARAVTTAGTGLGLAIVKATVEQHGGSIDVESEKDKGTTFRVFLNKPEG